MPADSTFDNPTTNPLSLLNILIEIFSRAHAKWGKALMNTNLALLLVVFRVTARKAWQ